MLDLEHAARALPGPILAVAGEQARGGLRAVERRGEQAVGAVGEVIAVRAEDLPRHQPVVEPST